MQPDDTPAPASSFSDFAGVLRSKESTLDPIPAEAQGRVHAAVSLILREADELEVLLIKRAEAEGDPWSGQMALPGGRQDPSDTNLLETAIRETEEEVALDLDKDGVHLGRLEALIPATRRLPPITIFPFVFGVPKDTEAEVSSREVDEVLWVPLSTLRDPSASSTVEIRYGDDSSRTFPCFRVEGRVVWGLTYRILNGFFETLATTASLP
ncbi:MAG: CoA pyrophosphatase [Gemmatimonadota bacterium]|jgi:8-oxo-dGTP pyrophosphatase MutT (NUDIX family)